MERRMLAGRGPRGVACGAPVTMDRDIKTCVKLSHLRDGRTLAPNGYAR